MSMLSTPGKDEVKDESHLGEPRGKCSVYSG